MAWGHADGANHDKEKTGGTTVLKQNQGENGAICGFYGTNTDCSCDFGLLPHPRTHIKRARDYHSEAMGHGYGKPFAVLSDDWSNPNPRGWKDGA